MGGTMPNDLLETNVLPRAYLWHMSGFNNKYVNRYLSDIEYKNLLDDFRAKGGYRLSIDEATFPSEVPKGQTFSINVNINNSGTAPLYRRFYNLSVRLDPVSSGNETVITLEGDLTTVLPDQISTFTGEYSGDLDVGNYDVYVGITGDPEFDPLPPPVSLANC